MSKKMLGRMIQDDGTLSLVLDSKSYTVDTSHPQYAKLKKAVTENDGDAFLDSFNAALAAQKAINESVAAKKIGLVVDDDGNVTANGVPVDSVVAEAIRKLQKSGGDIVPVVKFLERLLTNLSYNVQGQLWQFLNACGLTLTEDGCFLAYKAVRSDYYDKYTGTILNSVGAVIPRFERNQVDDNPQNHCSKGYHCGALEYAGPGGYYNAVGDKVMIVKVAPEDVVSVPTDHSFRKLRCCFYEVVGEFEGRLDRVVYEGKVGESYKPADDYGDDDDEAYELTHKEIYDLDEVFEGDILVFSYDSKPRIGLVVDVQFDNYDDNDKGLVTLLTSKCDSAQGGYRTFDYGRMADVRSFEDEKDAERFFSTL